MTPTWYRHRGYAHFDRGVRLDQIEPQVSDPKQVATWAFFPFLHYKKVDEHIRGRAQAKVKKRPISYACHRDSHLYSYYANVLLNPPYERLLKHLALEDRVIAFRHGQGSNISMSRRAFDAISQLAPCTVYAFDVSKFFDRMDHAVLKSVWKKILGIHESAPLPDDHYAVFKSLTRFSYVHRTAALRELRIGQRRFDRMNSRMPLCDPQAFRDIVRGRKLVVVNENRYGIPQGSPISALLSNIYLLDFDQVISATARLYGGQYWRYCDDILIVIPTANEYSANVEFTAINKIKDLNLEINQKKTEVFRFSRTPQGELICEARSAQTTAFTQGTKPLQYLGFTFDGRKIMIRPQSLDRNRKRMNKAVKLARSTQRSQNEERASTGEPVREIFTRKLLRTYGSLGDKNFHGYAKRSEEAMDSKSIKRQRQRRTENLGETIKRTAKPSDGQP